MSPRRATYHPPRPCREVIIAVAASVGLTAFTVVMVWVLGPHPSAAPSTPTRTVPPSVSTTGPSASAPASSTPSSPPSS